MQAALDAIQVHGANGYSNEFPVERYLRNSKAAVIYEGTSQLHTLIQADYALGYREDKPLRCEPLPAQGWTRPGERSAMTVPRPRPAGRRILAITVVCARRPGLRAVARDRRRRDQRQSPGGLVRRSRSRAVAGGFLLGLTAAFRRRRPIP